MVGYTMPSHRERPLLDHELAARLYVSLGRGGSDSETGVTPGLLVIAIVTITKVPFDGGAGASYATVRELRLGAPALMARAWDVSRGLRGPGSE